MKNSLTTLAQYSFFFLTFVLAVFGANSMFRVSPDPDMKSLYLVYGILMLGDALAMLGCGLLIKRKITVVFWFAVGLLCLNIFLSIFDQFGWVDMLFVLFNASTLGLILNLRKELTPQ
jgi:hypothetical protein